MKSCLFAVLIVFIQLSAYTDTVWFEDGTREDNVRILETKTLGGVLRVKILYRDGREEWNSYVVKYVQDESPAFSLPELPEDLTFDDPSHRTFDYIDTVLHTYTRWPILEKKMKGLDVTWEGKVKSITNKEGKYFIVVSMMGLRIREVEFTIQNYSHWRSMMQNIIINSGIAFNGTIDSLSSSKIELSGAKIISAERVPAEKMREYNHAEAIRIAENERSRRISVILSRNNRKIEGYLKHGIRLNDPGQPYSLGEEHLTLMDKTGRKFALKAEAVATGSRTSYRVQGLFAGQQYTKADFTVTWNIYMDDRLIASQSKKHKYEYNDRDKGKTEWIDRGTFEEDKKFHIVVVEYPVEITLKDGSKKLFSGGYTLETRALPESYAIEPVKQ